jgi:hypothetical protein
MSRKSTQMMHIPHRHQHHHHHTHACMHTLSPVSAHTHEVVGHNHDVALVCGEVDVLALDQDLRLLYFGGAGDAAKAELDARNLRSRAQTQIDVCASKERQGPIPPSDKPCS